MRSSETRQLRAGVHVSKQSLAHRCVGKSKFPLRCETKKVFVGILDGEKMPSQQMDWLRYRFERDLLSSLKASIFVSLKATFFVTAYAR